MHGDFRAGTEKRGVNPRRRNGTVRCDVISDWRSNAGHSGKTGEGFAERMGFCPHTKSGYSVPSLFGGFPAGAYASA